MAELLEVRNVRRSFPRSGGEELLVLDDVNLTLKEGEIVGLLGRSGSGKSTLLRLIAGLARPQGGTLTYMGQAIEGPAQGVAMVFQGFALFPWMTVLENVQLGLEALGLPESEIRKRALAAIDLIGLDGYESAYPRELSGGMRQRVGFARARRLAPGGDRLTGEQRRAAADDHHPLAALWQLRLGRQLRGDTPRAGLTAHLCFEYARVCLLSAHTRPL